jgi:NodT family efflux transporter outer membrane factor (OMF) lipoprotein
MKRNGPCIVFWAVPLLTLTSCAVGPDYVRPSVETPAAFKELDGWKPAQPRDREIRGKWWEMFNDPSLNELEEQLDISNQNLALAAAQFREARALGQSARAGYFPVVTSAVSATRSRSASTAVSAMPGRVSTERSLTLDATWEADVWGRVRRTVESGEASAQASAADLGAARLSAHAELAQDYFQLRALDAQQRLLEDTVANYEKSLQLTQNQYRAGVTAKVDVALANTQLKTTQAQAIDIGVQRAQLEHAIALLIGETPSVFSITPSPLPLTAVPPPIPVGVPSALLERRPDIAAAERRVAAANAQIGVAQSAYFPSLTLSASAGYQSTNLAQWLTAPSRFWSIGPALAETLFDGGSRRAQTEAAVAAYDANAAAYRQTVLTGFQEVEDNLAALRILEQEAAIQTQAVESAQQSVRLTTNQYKAGIVSYLNVITVQTVALGDERAAVDILSRRLAASVLLVKALGGGWNASHHEAMADDDKAARYLKISAPPQPNDHSFINCSGCGPGSFRSAAAGLERILTTV